MATSARIRKLAVDYEERVYAGLLGAAIGGAVGRRYLGDLRTLAPRELGKIGYDFNSSGDFSPCFAFDSLTTALTSARVFEDFGFTAAFGSEQVAHTWLNYAIENRAVLCWGGAGNSAAHTAFLNLKKGIPAPASGSISCSGSPVAEQSGAEACATVWGMICPNDIERAADLAGRAARVAYDGAAVHAAQAVAAFVSAAFFSANTMDAIVCAGEHAVPPGCAVAQLIGDLRDWHAHGETWEHTRERVLDKYVGGSHDERHAIPHFAGVVLALLQGGGELAKSLALAAAAGWGTAANLSVIGAVLGVKNGLAGIDANGAWRAAINDRIYLPSADAGRCVSDLATEAMALCRMGRELQRVPCAAPKKGARFHFELPGSTHGLEAEVTSSSPGLAMLRNVAGHSRSGKRGLALIYSAVDGGHCARLSAAVFPPREKRASGLGDFLIGSPNLYPGQTIRAYVEARAENKQQVGVRPFIRYFGERDELCLLPGPEKWLLPDARHEFQWTLPNAVDAEDLNGTQRVRHGVANRSDGSLLLGRPIAEVGLEIFSEHPAEGVIYLDYLTWDGAPCAALGPPSGSGSLWRHAWVNAATQCDFGKGAAPLRICQNDGIGLVIQGTRTWRDYTALANVAPRMARCAGIAIRVQGLQRYYALLLCPGNKVRLVKQFHGMTVLAEADFPWTFGQTVELVLSAEGKRLSARANGRDLFVFDDPSASLDGGAFALVVEEGCMEAGCIRVTPNP